VGSAGYLFGGHSSGEGYFNDLWLLRLGGPFVGDWRWLGGAVVTNAESTFTGAAKVRKLGQLQPFLAVFPQECMGQLASFGPT
jgi:hypothetical protein